MTAAPIALLVLALLVYGLTVGCQAHRPPLNVEPYAHRDCEVREGERNGAWHVVFVCACNRWSYREVHR